MSDQEIHLGPGSSFYSRDPTVPNGWGVQRTRIRPLRAMVLSGTNMRHIYGPPVYTSNTFPVSGIERTVDATHWAWKFAKFTPFAEWDNGGDFDSRKIWVDTQSGSIQRTDASGTWESYSGALFAHTDVYHLLKNMKGPTQVDLPYPYRDDDVGASLNELKTHGATAIARTLPTAPSVNVAQSLGELREGLPSLTGRAARRGDAGGEFLNYQFGIRPTASDIQAYRLALTKTEEILAQWKRDSGRRVRRRYTFAPEKTVETTVHTGQSLTGTTGTFPYATSGTGETTVTKTTTSQYWFSGAYRYFIPKIASSYGQKLQELTRIYGVPTPDALWELTQYSWLVDWQTNLGDIITNVSQLGHDDLVLTYGYVMCHSNVTYDYVWKGLVYSGSVPQLTTVRTSVQMDVKQRVAASPYGVGWTGESLSAKQWAILAALGLSRSLR